MIKIAIVEDEKTCVERVESHLEKYSKGNDVTFDISVFDDGDKIADHYQPIYDLIFMDVEMKNLNGFSAAEQIREFDKDVIIIFITNMANYAIEGYKVDALSYLLKPVTYFALSHELTRSIERIKRKEKKYLMIQNKTGFFKLDIKDILYIESYKHKLIVYTDKDEYTYTQTVKEVEKELITSNFHRCNNGYLVNLIHVTGVHQNIVEVGKFSLQVSRPRKKEFLNALTNYLGGIS